MRLAYFEAEATLRAPVAGRGDLNLAALAMAALSPEEHGAYPSSSEPPPAPDVPIRYALFKGRRVYMASNVDFQNVAQRSATHMTKRRDGEDDARLAKPYAKNGGAWRPKMKAYPVIVAESAMWRAMVNEDDAPSLEDALSEIKTLGGLRAHGYGRIAEWKFRVDEDADPLAAVFTTEGGYRHFPQSRVDNYSFASGTVTARSFPAEWWDDDYRKFREEAPLPLTLPYWHADSIALCKPAGATAIGFNFPQLEGDPPRAPWAPIWR